MTKLLFILLLKCVRCSSSEVGEDGYQFVKNGDMFRVTNLLKEFKITASKVWSDGNGNHSAESVKFLLGSSTTKVLSGVPDDIQWGSDEVTLNEANNWKHEWTKLPGYTKVGNDYKQLYYYIKEIDLATGYEAVYSATAMSKNTDVTVTNVKGLNITKEWRDELGNKLADSELPAGIDKIEADVYESSVAPNSTTRVNGDNGIPTDCKLIKTVSLEKSKNWTVTLDGLDKDKYYYVLEKNIPDGFGVTYTYSNNGSATGFDTIVNTKNPQKVENMDVRLQKAWSDGDSNTHTNDKVTFNIYRSTNKADVPEKYNKFTGTMDKGQNVKFKILTSNGTEMAQNGSFASEYAMYGSAKFSFDMTKSWINIGETEGRVRVLDSSGAVLADIYKSGENWVDGKAIPIWSGDSKYVSVSDYVTPSWDKSQFVVNLNNITSDITVELTLKGDSGCSYAVTANDLGTPEKTNVTPVPNKDAIPSGEVFLWKQITLTADNNWSNAVSLEKNDIKGNKYYYWFEEIDVNGQPVSTSSYKAYYRYNGSENENCIDMTKNGDQYVQVYNNSEETLGELPETGGMGVIPFVAAGGTVTVAATLLLVTKRRKKRYK
ncbi:MAG: Cna B-type domain-containing protein [Ruminococcus bicirculans (ex Wegman et al. 2014)]